MEAADEPRPEVQPEVAEDADPDEPVEGSRMSPYAIAAFATAIFALWVAPQSIGFFIGAVSESWAFALKGIAAPAVPVVGAVAALWLANLGFDDIDAAPGRLRGWSFCRGARMIAIAVLVLVGISVAAAVFTGPNSIGLGR
jgi:hypothetical protein